jgi:hypothetical protein
MENGSLLGIDYQGFANPYSVSDLTITEDNGLAIVGTTSIAGRFSRICLIKLSEEEMRELAGI